MTTPARSADFALNIERLDTISALLPGVTYCFRAKGEEWWMEYIDPGVEELCGVSQEEAYRDIRTLIDLILPEDQPRFISSVEEAIAAAKTWHCQYRMKHPRTGNIIWISGQSQRHDAGDGTAVYYGALIDITEEIETERRLLQDAELARLSFTQAPIGEFVIDGDAQFRRINEAFCDLLGSSQDQLLLQDLFQHIPASHDVTRLRETIVRLQRTPLEQEELEIHLRHLDGHPLHTQVRLVKLHAPGETQLLMGVVHDITDRERREAERLNASKFESLGLLAGGIAHDLNNIIMGISLNLELAGMSADGDEDLTTSLQEARTATGRAADLSRRLLMFAKGGEPDLGSVDLAHTLRSTIDFSLRGSTLLAEFDFSETLAPVWADGHQISQVIENLVINAREASPHGGTLYVKADNISLAPGQVLNLEPGGYVKVEVIDEGEGIPRELLTRIFDPYFTTKPSGNGIGLATCYSLIKKHGGEITVRSEVGKGTSFSIFLPMAQSDPAPEENDPPQPPKGQGRILVVDDDAMILQSLSRAILSLGYDVEGAADGPHAVELFAQAHQLEKPYDVVLLDATIPGGGGGDVAFQAIRNIRRDACIVLCSGYGQAEPIRNWKDKGYAAQLDKPSSIHDIGQLLARLTS